MSSVLSPVVLNPIAVFLSAISLSICSIDVGTPFILFCRDLFVVKGLLFDEEHDEEDDVACDDDCNDDELRFDIFCLALVIDGWLEMDWKWIGMEMGLRGFGEKILDSFLFLFHPT